MIEKLDLKQASGWVMLSRKINELIDWANQHESEEHVEVRRLSRADMAVNCLRTMQGDSGWIRVTDELPDYDETVWGYDCFYGKQGACERANWGDGHLIWGPSDDDCSITHWRPIPTSEDPSEEEIQAVNEIREKRETKEETEYS